MSSVSEVRARYMRGLEQGLSQERATEYANTGKEPKASKPQKEKPAPAPEPETPKAEETQADDLPALREEYKAVIGKAPFNGWAAETLKAKIADAKAG